MERVRKFYLFFALGLMLSFNVKAQPKKEANPYFTTTTSFTPNGDGNNDVWKLNWQATPDSLHLTIYNRWGQIIAESKRLDFEWNGKNRKNKDTENGIYVFSVEIYTFGEVKKYNGSITLIR